MHAWHACMKRQPYVYACMHPAGVCEGRTDLWTASGVWRVLVAVGERRTPPSHTCNCMIQILSKKYKFDYLITKDK